MDENIGLIKDGMSNTVAVLLCCHLISDNNNRWNYPIIGLQARQSMGHGFEVIFDATATRFQFHGDPKDYFTRVEQTRECANHFVAGARAIAETFGHLDIMDTEPLRIEKGDKVEIHCHGEVVQGLVISAVNWGSVGHDDWYIEYRILDGGCGYWKQGVDGGRVEKIS
jgi:hypothetical protein